jgi:hypothetical protein
MDIVELSAIKLTEPADASADSVAVRRASDIGPPRAYCDQSGLYPQWRT